MELMQPVPRRNPPWVRRGRCSSCDSCHATTNVGSVTKQAASGSFHAAYCELNSVERDQDGRRKADREYQGGKALGVRSVEQVGGAEKRRAEEQDNERHQGLRHGRQRIRDGAGGLMPVRRF